MLLGGLLLVVMATLLWRWRRSAVRTAVPAAREVQPRSAHEPVDARLPLIRGELLWLIVQRAGQSSVIRGTTVAPEVIAEAKELLARRQMVEAIELVRGRTGWGLKESKDFVDGLRW
jgi:hypothetical protein